MTQYWIELASIMAVFSFAIVAPGADTAMVMRQAIVHGRRAAILTSIGVGVSLMFHVSYTILGLGLIISQSILLFNLLKWLGVAYLVYIGVQSLRAGRVTLDAGVPDASGKALPQTAFKGFALGFLANALNPKPVFFFLSVFSAIVSHETPGGDQVRLRSGDGGLPDRLVRRRVLLPDDAAHACRFRAGEQVDQPRERRRLHCLRPQACRRKGGLT